MKLKKLNKKHMLSLAIAGLATGLISVNASAAVNGPYIGGQIGYGNVHQDGFSKSDVPSAVNFKDSSKDTGVAGRVFGGYQVNQNFAAEVGYSKFSNATSKASFDTVAPTTTVKANATIKTYAVDLVGKGILPLQNGFSVYGKAGLAYLSETAEGNVNVTKKGFGAPTTTRVKVKDSAHHIYPTFGGGLSYDVTQNLVADVSWNHIQKTGSSEKLANTDLYAVGLAYNFG